MTAKFTGRMTCRKRHVGSIATLSVIGLALLVSDGPECGCSSGCACSPITPPSAFHQTAEKAERPLKSAEARSHSVNASSEQTGQAGEAGPLLEIKDVKLEQGVAEGVAIRGRNGTPLAIVLRADRGVIVCTHFSVDSLDDHGVPAASVPEIQSIEELLKAKVVSVNTLASALDVHPGMPVREALDKMTAGSESPDEGAADYRRTATFSRYAHGARGQLIRVHDIRCSSGTARAIAIYRPNGKLLALLIRADRGAITCGHFSLDALEGHGVPAASIRGIGDFHALVEHKLVGVNTPASALGVRAGISVREALEQMMDPGQASQ